MEEMMAPATSTRAREATVPAGAARGRERGGGRRRRKGPTQQQGPR